MMLAVFDIIWRYLHIIFAVLWIGHNYANLVQNPTFIALHSETSDEDRDLGLTRRMQREHGAFRYASLVVLISGLAMLWYRGTLLSALSLDGHQAVIGIGVWLGIIMVGNLWFVLWPHQKKVLGFVAAPLDERIRCSRITFLSSRSNTILSIPLVFFMVAGSHGLVLF